MSFISLKIDEDESPSLTSDVKIIFSSFDHNAELRRINFFLGSASKFKSAFCFNLLNATGSGSNESVFFAS